MPFADQRLDAERRDVIDVDAAFARRDGDKSIFVGQVRVVVFGWRRFPAAVQRIAGRLPLAVVVHVGLQRREDHRVAVGQHALHLFDAMNLIQRGVQTIDHQLVFRAFSRQQHRRAMAAIQVDDRGREKMKIPALTRPISVSGRCSSANKISNSWTRSHWRRKSRTPCSSRLKKRLGAAKYSRISRLPGNSPLRWATMPLRRRRRPDAGFPVARL